MYPVIEVDVSNRLWMRLEQVPKPAAQWLRNAFEHNNPAYHKKRQMGYGVGKEVPVVKTWKHEHDDEGATWLSLPRGGTQRFRDMCDEFDLDYEFIDKMSRGNVLLCGGEYTGDWVSPQMFPNRKQTPWDHQERIIEAMLSGKQGVVRAPTGSGKTNATIEAIRQANVPAIVVVWESGLLEQWQQRIEALLGIKKKHQGLIRSQTCRLRPITLAMQQTINKWGPEKWVKIDGVFGFVIADELQRYAADTFTETIDQFDCAMRIGASADETRKDQKEFLIYDFFGKIICDVPKKELEGKGIIHEVDAEVIPTEFQADWYIDEPQPDFSTLLQQMVGDADRNDLIVDVAKRYHDAGETILLFTHRIEHCHTLRALLAMKGIAAEYMLGGAGNQKDFVRTVERMRDLNDPLRIAIGTLGKVGVGLDIPNLTVGIATTPIHNNKQFMGQVKGRICRSCSESGKTHAKLVYMWDRDVFGRQPLLNLNRWNKEVHVQHHHEMVEIIEYLKEHYEDKSTSQIGPFATAESIR